MSPKIISSDEEDIEEILSTDEFNKLSDKYKYDTTTKGNRSSSFKIIEQVYCLI